MPKSNPYHSAGDLYPSISLRLFNQADYLDGEEEGVCLVLCFKWAYHFFNQDLTTYQLLSSMQSSENMNQIRKTQSEIGMFEPTYAVKFKAKLDILAKETGFDAQCTTSLSPLLSLTSRNISDRAGFINGMIKNLLGNDGAVFIVLYNQYKNNGHTIVLTSQSITNSYIKLSCFDPCLGEASCAYHEDEIDLVKRRLCHNMADELDANLLVTSQTFYEWVNHLIDYYSDNHIYDAMKFYYVNTTKQFSSVSYCHNDNRAFRHNLYHALATSSARTTEEKTPETSQYHIKFFHPTSSLESCSHEAQDEPKAIQAIKFNLS